MVAVVVAVVMRAHLEPRHGLAADDGGGGEEKEGEGQHRVGQPQVHQQQAARLPRLNNNNDKNALRDIYL